MKSGRTGGRGPRSVWSESLRESYLALLRETGNAGASARLLGHPTLFQGRRARDPVFRRQCLEAVAQADARLRAATGAFQTTDPRLPPVEVKSMPAGDDPPLPGPRQPMIRRTSNGRTQISYVHEGEMSSADEDRFVERLRITGQFDASAVAIGFHPSTLHRRLRKWPDFARRCEEARDEASVILDYKLAAHAHALLLGPGEDRIEGEEEAPFDPEAAMRILHFLDRRKAGRLGSRPRKGPPERTFEQAVESILAKVEAIKRHREMMKGKAAREGDHDAGGQGPAGGAHRDAAGGAADGPDGGRGNLRQGL